MHIKANADIYAAMLDGTQQIDFDLRSGRRSWIQVARGEVVVNNQSLVRGDGLAINGAGRVQLRDGDNAEILLFDLEAS